MGVPQSEGRMEGWLYLIRSNRFGQHYLRKRYFNLKDNVLRSFKDKPVSQMEVHSLSFYHKVSSFFFFFLSVCCEEFWWFVAPLIRLNE